METKPLTPIPDGWYLIDQDYLIMDGDKYESIDNWNWCRSSIGQTPAQYGRRIHDGFYVIRLRTAPVKQPEPEREWLNAWE